MKRLGILVVLLAVGMLALPVFATDGELPHQTDNCDFDEETQFKYDIDTGEWEPEDPGVTLTFTYSEEGEVIGVDTGDPMWVIVCAKVPQPDKGAGISHIVIECIREDTTTTTVEDTTTTTVEDTTTTTVEDTTTTTEQETTTTTEEETTTTTEQEETTTTVDDSTTTTEQEETTTTVVVTTPTTEDAPPVLVKGPGNPVLPFTGADSIPMTVGASLLLLAGIGLVRRFRLN